MRFSETIQLIATVYKTDDLKQVKPTDGEVRTVYANPYTIGRGEFEAASQQGLRPDCAYQVNTVDYAGEEKAKVNGVAKRVYRTTVNGDRTTIYMTEAVADGK